MRISDWSSDVCSSDRRVYKNFDPRAKIIREMCHEVLDELGVDDPMLEVAMRLEEAALQDDYFVQRKLYPNVDFYSGIIYKALGIPTEMFTVMFAIARTAGWVAHWLEQQERSEEHTSEIQSLMRISYAVFCLNKKKQTE